MLLSNVGFAVNTHYCSGQAIGSSISLGVDQLHCSMSEETASCQQGQVLEKTCCENEHHLIQLDENAEKQASLSHLSVPFVAVLVAVVGKGFLFEPLAAHTRQWVLHAPPLRKQDRQVLFQSFLI